MGPPRRPCLVKRPPLDENLRASHLGHRRLVDQGNGPRTPVPVPPIPVSPFPMDGSKNAQPSRRPDARRLVRTRFKARPGLVHASGPCLTQRARALACEAVAGHGADLEIWKGRRAEASLQHVVQVVHVVHESLQCVALGLCRGRTNGPETSMGVVDAAAGGAAFLRRASQSCVAAEVHNTELTTAFSHTLGAPRAHGNAFSRIARPA